MSAPFDEDAARKLLAEWPEVPGLDDLVAAFVEARAAIEAYNAGGDAGAWDVRKTPCPKCGHRIVTTKAELPAEDTAPQPAAETRREPLVGPIEEDMLIKLLRSGRATAETQNDAANWIYRLYNQPEMPAAPQPAAEAWRPIASAPRDGTQIMVWNGAGRHLATWRDNWPYCDPFFGWVIGGGYIINPTLWQPLPPSPGAPTPADAIPPEGLAAAEAALERLEARKAVPADEWAAQVAGAFVKLGSDAESLGTRRVDPAAAVDAVRIVERMRDAYDRAAHDCRNHFDARGAFLNKLHAADEILAALRGEAR